MQRLYEFILKWFGLRAIDKEKQIAGGKAISAGFFFATLATGLIWVLLQALFWIIETIFGIDGRNFETNWVLLVGAFLISQAYFFAGGLVKIRIVHCAVPLFLGKRPTETDKDGKIPVLSEGYNWVLPWPIMGCEEISLELNTFELENPMEVLSGGEQSKDEGVKDEGAKRAEKNINRVAFKIQAGILFYIDKKKLNRYLEARAKFTETILDIIRSVVREEAAKKDDEELLSMGYEEIAKALLAKLTNPTKDKGDPYATRLGIEVVRVLVTKIVPFDEKMTRQYERIKKEKLDLRAEAVEADNFIALVNKVRDGLGRDGISAEKAADYIQAERGKATRVIIDGGIAGDFTTAEALRQAREQTKQ
ncbi:MAG: hypothetical protein A2648_02960 [Candidatus Lloydbacteria bacterium RIFCSPHIGHO2_01_FULL_41_20]|uniref:Band 7 domain-containing protein n=1 Tax=Candidatus Lloydbacteria bacterium RIFCSPHIGHO2_01_FULL_41_20 TaxID=1798657 RepID=A0A1G2CRT6_9BACT|nr:MAG: hypothetical protein A2648_02960 [Candidatus Lloydbacteria bacterium RIFCSPHIGHO2_01_FULL_41_20]